MLFDAEVLHREIRASKHGSSATAMGRCCVDRRGPSEAIPMTSVVGRAATAMGR